MKLSLETFAVIASLLTFAAGVVMWYGGMMQKRYAAQRDFEHLKRNYSQLAENQQLILKDMDARFDQQMLELKELKGLVTVIVVKISPSGNQTGSWGKD